MKIQTMFKAAVLLGAALAACGLALARGAQVQPIQAAPLDHAAFDPYRAPLQQTMVCSDTYEPNNSLATAKGQFSPAPGGSIPIANLTFSSSGFTPSTADQDYYSVSVIQTGYVYTFTATPDSAAVGIQLFVYDVNNNFVAQRSGNTGSPVTLSWWASQVGAYKVLVAATNPGAFGDPCGADKYRIRIQRAAAAVSATPTPTATTTRTPTPSATATSQIPLTDTLDLQAGWPDGNGAFDKASAVSANASYSNLTFYWRYPSIDIDYYRVWTKAGRSYRAETSVMAGLDTYLEVYDTQLQLVASNDDRATNNYGSLVEWTVGNEDNWFYLKVTNKDPSDPRYKAYQLIITDITVAATLTPTPQPSCGSDAFEPNNDMANARFIQVGITYHNLTFSDSNGQYDIDLYRIWGKSAWGRYQLDTSGWDTLVYIFGPATTGMDPPTADDQKGPLIGQNDDKAYNDTGSRIVWTAPSDGWYTIIVDRPAGAKAQPGCGPYSIVITPLDVTPTPQPTAEAGPTPVMGYDQFEPNHNFDYATIIGLGVKYSNLNFVPYAPWNGHWEDNDFFKLRVKPGLLVTCETFDLSVGTDTNMIIYSESQANECGRRPVDQCQGLAGNDDVNTAAGDFRSRISYFATFEGWLYILVGQGHTVPIGEASKYTYSLQCAVGQQSTATPAPAPSPTNVYLPPPQQPTYTPYPTYTPWPTQPEDTPGPTATPTPLPPIGVRPLPTATPAGPPRQMINLEMRVFYDSDENNQPDAGEGVIGLQAQVYDLTDGALLAQGFTDETGAVAFSVSALGTVKVVVSYLNFEAIVPPNGGALQVRVSPRQLPSLIP